MPYFNALDVSLLPFLEPFFAATLKAGATLEALAVFEKYTHIVWRRL